MKPARFEYERPDNLADAIALAGRVDIVVKMLAGGQSLGPMLNLRLAQPDLLVDITCIPELRRAEETADAVILGACITHADIEDGRVPDATRGAVPDVARDIAYRAVRNRGTIGGSLCHADPAADWVSCLGVIGAEALIQGPSGRRSASIDRFMEGAFEAALEQGEILEAVRIPRMSAGARWGYCKISRKTGEMAHAIGAILYDPDRSLCRVVIGAIASTPIFLGDASSLFGGNPHAGLLESFDPDAAIRALAGAGIMDPVDRQIHLAALQRAIARAARA